MVVNCIYTRGVTVHVYSYRQFWYQSLCLVGMFTEQIQHRFNYCMSGTSLEIEVNLRTTLCAIYMFASIFLC